jgi:uncharacterized protein with PIN domain
VTKPREFWIGKDDSDAAALDSRQEAEDFIKGIPSGEVIHVVEVLPTEPPSKGRHPDACPVCDGIGIETEQEYEPGIMAEIYKCDKCGMEWLTSRQEKELDAALLQNRNAKVRDLEAMLKVCEDALIQHEKTCCHQCAGDLTKALAQLAKMRKRK